MKTQRVMIEVEVSAEDSCGNCEYARTKGETHCELLEALGAICLVTIFPSEEGPFRWMRCAACLKRWPLEVKG